MQPNNTVFLQQSPLRSRKENGVIQNWRDEGDHHPTAIHITTSIQRSADKSNSFALWIKPANVADGKSEVCKTRPGELEVEPLTGACDNRTRLQSHTPVMLLFISHLLSFQFFPLSPCERARFAPRVCLCVRISFELFG